MTSASKLKQALYALPCTVKEEPIYNRLAIMFNSSRIVYIDVDDNSDIDIPWDVINQLTEEQRELLNEAIWAFRATPPFMRKNAEWRKEAAKEAYFDNMQLLREEIGAFERHWLDEEQGLLKNLF